MKGLEGQNSALMSPPNQTNRNNLLNDTRGSIQSSVFKNDGRHHQLNSSFGGVSGMSLGINGQSNGGINMRIMSSSSFDHKMIPGNSNNTSIVNVNQTPQHLKQNDKLDVKEYQKVKQSAEHFHTKGYEARKNGDYDFAI